MADPGGAGVEKWRVAESSAVATVANVPVKPGVIELADNSTGQITPGHRWIRIDASRPPLAETHPAAGVTENVSQAGVGEGVTGGGVAVGGGVVSAGLAGGPAESLCH